MDIQKIKNSILKSKKGSEIADRFESSLKRHGFNRIMPEDINDIFLSVKKIFCIIRMIFLLIIFMI
ncbi:hypothetical protein [uncultured Brachyspira sp.]|uniref:hypothetical protein n=1 Tax=uncultured Brachyspira sp. TaxID=221953 RepID=UPI002633E224|nr:hypothetical protein [uncultured Brachyspira sp.]